MAAIQQEKILGLPDGVNLDEIETAATNKLTSSDERLLERFEVIDTKSIEHLTEGGRHLVEWGTAAVGILFASLALLENPDVQQAFQKAETQMFGIITVLSFLLAVLLGFFVSIPSRFQYRPDELVSMETILRRVFDGKHRLLVVGSFFFVLGTMSMGLLVCIILLSV